MALHYTWQYGELWWAYTDSYIWKSYSLTWQTDHSISQKMAFKVPLMPRWPFPRLCSKPSLRLLFDKIARIGSYWKTAMCTIDYATKCVGTWTIHQCSIKFLSFAQAFSALIRINCQNGAHYSTASCTVDYATMGMGTSTIHLCSIKSSLPSFYPLRHSRDELLQAISRFYVLQVTES